jgi:hypothetical protein
MAGGILRLTLNGDRSFLGINVGRAFPISNPSRYIGFQDRSGKDIGILVDPSRLDAESRRVLEAELERRYFVPVVEEILEVTEEFGAVYWQARTDRGEKEIVVRNLKDSIHELPGSRAMIIDVDGNRFLIPDTRRLDPKSTNILLRGL